MHNLRRGGLRCGGTFRVAWWLGLGDLDWLGFASRLVGGWSGGVYSGGIWRLTWLCFGVVVVGWTVAGGWIKRT